MGELKTLFFDNYAFYEIINGNDNYKKYQNGINIVTTKLNLMELHYGLILSYGKEIADKYYDLFVPFVIEINDEIIKLANEFRFQHKKKKLSYVDCIGYTLANSRNIKFLTGDKEFEKMYNVEFVK